VVRPTVANTSAHILPLKTSGNQVSVSIDTNASNTHGGGSDASDNQRAGSDLNQRHDSSGSNPAPMEGYPLFLTDDDNKFLKIMLQEWKDDYPIDKYLFKS
jgi:hypothetical protein